MESGNDKVKFEKVSSEEAQDIDSYKKCQKKHFGDPRTLKELWLKDFDETAYPDLDIISGLRKYLDEKEKYVRKLVKCAYLRQYHFEKYIMGRREEEIGHMKWRVGLNSVADHAVKTLNHWEEIHNKEFEEFIEEAYRLDPNRVVENPEYLNAENVDYDGDDLVFKSSITKRKAGISLAELKRREEEQRLLEEKALIENIEANEAAEREKALRMKEKLTWSVMNDRPNVPRSEIEDKIFVPWELFYKVLQKYSMLKYDATIIWDINTIKNLGKFRLDMSKYTKEVELKLFNTIYLAYKNSDFSRAYRAGYPHGSVYLNNWRMITFNISKRYLKSNTYILEILNGISAHDEINKFLKFVGTLLYIGYTDKGIIGIIENNPSYKIAALILAKFVYIYSSGGIFYHLLRYGAVYNLTTDYKQGKWTPKKEIIYSELIELGTQDRVTPKLNLYITKAMKTMSSRGRADYKELFDYIQKDANNIRNAWFKRLKIVK